MAEDFLRKFDDMMEPDAHAHLINFFLDREELIPGLYQTSDITALDYINILGEILGQIGHRPFFAQCLQRFLSYDLGYYRTIEYMLGFSLDYVTAPVKLASFLYALLRDRGVQLYNIHCEKKRLAVAMWALIRQLANSRQATRGKLPGTCIKFRNLGDKTTIYCARPGIVQFLVEY